MVERKTRFCECRIGALREHRKQIPLERVASLAEVLVAAGKTQNLGEDWRDEGVIAVNQIGWRGNDLHSLELALIDVALRRAVRAEIPQSLLGVEEAEVKELDVFVWLGVGRLGMTQTFTG